MPTATINTGQGPSSPGLLHLPSELRIQCLQYLDLRSLLTCRSVCGWLRELVDQAALLQYKIELIAAGMVDGPPSAVGTGERLKMLREHRRAWNDLKWKSEEIVHHPDGQIWELYGNVLALSKAYRRIRFIQLPSIIKKLQRKTWEVDTGAHIANFTIDPTQDLLVVIEPAFQGIRLHFRDLSTGNCHPLSIEDAPIYQTLPSGLYPPLWVCTVRIHNDRVGVMFTDERSYDQFLMIWNWRTCDRELCIRGPELVTFTFLSDQYIVIGCKRWEMKLAVFDYRCMESGTTKDTSALDCVYVFGLPFACRGFYAMGIWDRPSPAWTPADHLQVPFYIAPGNRILSVTVSSQGKSSTYLIPARTLLKELPSSDQGWMTIRDKGLDWEKWGRHGARSLSRCPYPQLWKCGVYGTKYARIADGEIHVFVMDPLSARTGVDCPWRSRLVEAGTDFFGLNPGNTFPCRVSARVLGIPRPSPYSSIMVAEDSLILVSEVDINHGNRRTVFKILTF